MTSLLSEEPDDNAPRVVLLSLSREDADPLLRAGLRGETPGHVPLRDTYTPRENWAPHRNAVTLLLAHLGGLGDAEQWVVGLAYADVLKAGRGTTRRRVRLVSAEVVLPAVPLSAVLAHGSVALREAVAASLGQLAHPLPRTIGDELVRLLDALQPGLRDRVRRKSRPALALDPQAQLARDRMVTLLRFGGFRTLARDPALQVDGLPQSLEAVRALWESEIIAEDSLQFPGWDLSAVQPGAWLRFEREERTLFLKNIDAKPGEQVTGGDIVYVRKDPDSVVVVQYKRAAVRSDGTTAGCRVDARLRSQLERLIGLDAPGDAGPGGDYRLSRRVGFVKLVEDRPTKVASGDMFKGYYFPADFLLQRLHRSGRSSIDVDPAADDYIDSLTFANLVAGGWIGSSGPLTTDILVKLYAEQLLDTSRPTTIAFDQPSG